MFFDQSLRPLVGHGSLARGPKNEAVGQMPWALARKKRTVVVCMAPLRMTASEETADRGLLWSRKFIKPRSGTEMIKKITKYNGGSPAVTDVSNGAKERLQEKVAGETDFVVGHDGHEVDGAA